MLLTELSLENYGVYLGKNKFNLTCNVDKPVILIGGKNGAGKTTILEAIMIALYGKGFLGKLISKKEYHEFLSEKIHSHGKNLEKSASLQISFLFHHNKQEDLYAVKREWGMDGIETLTVKKNNELLFDIDQDIWKQFIENIIPIGIAKLFFLDGDKIVRMINWDKGSAEIHSSVESLVGLDLMERMQSDLKLYIMRRTGKGKNAKSDNALYKKLLAEKTNLNNEIKTLEEESTIKKIESDKLSDKIEHAETKIAKLGGIYADKRIRERDDRNKTIQDKIQIEQDLIEELSTISPFYIIPTLFNKISKQIDQDEQNIKKQHGETLLNERLDILTKKSSKNDIWSGIKLKESDKNKLMTRISKILKNNLKKKSNIMFNLSAQDIHEIKKIIYDVHDGWPKFIQLSTRFVATKSKLLKLEESLACTPQDDEIGPATTEINKLYEEMGTIKSEISYIERGILSKQAHIKIMNNKLKKVIETNAKIEHGDRGVKFAFDLHKTMDAYIKLMREKKIIQLEQYLLEAIRNLMHKNMLHKIHIDRETYKLTLYDSDSEQIRPKRLSKGEMQMIGTALLWAVAKASGRTLPFVIDTPLSRLDGNHRANLVERFYPTASHQMIILSTDKEIDKTEYSKLRPHIIKSYHIVHDDKKSITSISDGYFWKKIKGVTNAA